MSEVGKITIETVAGAGGLVRQISATVNVGGSLVRVQCESAQDPILNRAVDDLYARITSKALETVDASLGQERSDTVPRVGAVDRFVGRFLSRGQ